MPQVIITDECHQALLKASTLPFLATGKKRANGDWQIPLEWCTIERLRRYQLQGESLSDTILRIVASHKGSN
jgi:hypothetical protein